MPNEYYFSSFEQPSSVYNDNTQSEFTQTADLAFDEFCKKYFNSKHGMFNGSLRNKSGRLRSSSSKQMHVKDIFNVPEIVATAAAVPPPAHNYDVYSNNGSRKNGYDQKFVSQFENLNCNDHYSQYEQYKPQNGVKDAVIYDTQNINNGNHYNYYDAYSATNGYAKQDEPKNEHKKHENGKDHHHHYNHHSHAHKVQESPQKHHDHNYNNHVSHDQHQQYNHQNHQPNHHNHNGYSYDAYNGNKDTPKYNETHANTNGNGYVVYHDSSYQNGHNHHSYTNSHHHQHKHENHNSAHKYNYVNDGNNDYHYNYSYDASPKEHHINHTNNNDPSSGYTTAKYDPYDSNHDHTASSHKHEDHTMSNRRHHEEHKAQQNQIKHEEPHVAVKDTPKPKEEHKERRRSSNYLNNFKQDPYALANGKDLYSFHGNDNGQSQVHTSEQTVVEKITVAQESTHQSKTEASDKGKAYNNNFKRTNSNGKEQIQPQVQTQQQQQPQQEQFHLKNQLKVNGKEQQQSVRNEFQKSRHEHKQQAPQHKHHQVQQENPSVYQTANHHSHEHKHQDNNVQHVPSESIQQSVRAEVKKRPPPRKDQPKKRFSAVNFKNEFVNSRRHSSVDRYEDRYEDPYDPSSSNYFENEPNETCEPIIEGPIITMDTMAENIGNSDSGAANKIGRIGLKVIACGMEKGARLPIPRANYFIDKGNFGDDAGFWSEIEGHSAIGLADGATGNIMLGYDPGEFPRNLMELCSNLFVENPSLKDPRELLMKAFDLLQDKTVYGSCTACVLTLDNEKNQLKVANIGDSGYRLIRNGKIIKKSEPQRISADCPRQIDSYPWKAETRAMGVSYTEIMGGDCACDTMSIYKDDLIVLSSDGLYDNLEDDEIEYMFNKSPSLVDAAEKIVQKTVKHYKKPDDILVIVGRIVENKPISRHAMYSKEVKK